MFHILILYHYTCTVCLGRSYRVNQSSQPESCDNTSCKC